MKLCSIENCGRATRSLGFCRAHYYRIHLKRKIDLNEPIRSIANHNQSNSPEYYSWASLIQRCNNKKNPKYKIYGGRGITVCDRWLHSFPHFLEDMGYKPFLKAEIDRIDNDGNYEPSNCRWVTSKENCNNKRTNKLYKNTH